MKSIHESVEEYQEAWEQIYNAKEAAFKTLRRVMPPGSRVYWMHGDYERSGVVQRVYSDTVVVSSDISGKEVHIHAPRVEHVHLPRAERSFVPGAYGGETNCATDRRESGSSPAVVECPRPLTNDELRACYDEARAALERIDEALQRHGHGLPGAPSLVADVPDQVEKILALVATS